PNAPSSRETVARIALPALRSPGPARWMSRHAFRREASSPAAGGPAVAELVREHVFVAAGGGREDDERRGRRTVAGKLLARIDALHLEAKRAQAFLDACAEFRPVVRDADLRSCTQPDLFA